MRYTHNDFMLLTAAALQGSLAGQSKDYHASRYEIQSALTEALEGVKQGFISAGYSKAVEAYEPVIDLAAD